MGEQGSSILYCQDSLTALIQDVFNPAAVVANGSVHLLYRAEDKV